MKTSRWDDLVELLINIAMGVAPPGETVKNRDRMKAYEILMKGKYCEDK